MSGQDEFNAKMLCASGYALAAFELVTTALPKLLAEGILPPEAVETAIDILKVTRSRPAAIPAEHLALLDDKIRLLEAVVRPGRPLLN